MAKIAVEENELLIYTRYLMIGLKKRGYKFLREVEDPDAPKFMRYVFEKPEDQDKLKTDMAEIVAEHKAWMEAHPKKPVVAEAEAPVEAPAESADKTE